MAIMGTNLEKAYTILNSGDILKAKILFEIIYKFFACKKFIDNVDEKNNYIRCLLGLGEIYMKERNFEKSIQYYKKGYELTNGKDFNILFNLGVIYKNLGNNEDSKIFLDKARKINPKSELLNGYLFTKNNDNTKKSYIEYRIEEDKVIKGNRLYIFIYSLCSFKCCFCDRSTDDYKLKFKNKDTTLKDVLDLINNTNLTEIKSISIGGNEPLTNKDIDSILKYIDSLNKDICLYTSGSEFDKIEMLIKLKNIKVVYFPIYSTIGKIHDKIVGKNGAYKNLNKMKIILENYNIKVLFNKLVFKENIGDELYIKNSSLTLLHPRDKKLYIDNAVKLSTVIEKKYKKIDLDTIIYLNKYLNIPLCILIKKIDIKSELDRINIINTLKDNKIDMINVNMLSSYGKLKNCEKCVLNDNCIGYFKYYFEKFGGNEIEPILDII